MTTLLLAGNVNSNAADLVDYKPKTTFTSSADINSFRGVNEDFSEQEVNKLFGLSLDKRKIVMNDIKSYGDFTVEIKLHAGISAKITVSVTE